MAGIAYNHTPRVTDSRLDYPRMCVNIGNVSIAREEQPQSRFALLEVAFHNFNYVIGGFFGRFRIPGHVVADVILHEFRHEGVDGAARGSEALQYVRTMFIFVQAAKN